MKTSLKLIALLLAAGYPVAAFAQFVGASIPAVANAQNVAVLSTIMLVGLMLLKDYSRPSVSLVRKCPVIAPPAECFGRRTDRLAA
jgi:hypothetical protein